MSALGQKQTLQSGSPASLTVTLLLGAMWMPFPTAFEAKVKVDASASFLRSKVSIWREPLDSPSIGRNGHSSGKEFVALQSH